MSEYIQHDRDRVSVGVVAEDRRSPSPTPPDEMRAGKRRAAGAGDASPTKPTAALAPGPAQRRAGPARPLGRLPRGRRTTQRRTRSPGGGTAWSGPARASTPTGIFVDLLQHHRQLHGLDRPELHSTRPPAGPTAWTSRWSPSATWSRPRRR
ncbi:MAG: hypothetical protein MZV64_04510 [Ignavibacteriales bacterium]|nr:hypothetical protein [Ignavibacteriales bacterium]